MANSLAFKCYLSCNKLQEKEIRRFSLDPEVLGNYTYLLEKVRFTYPQLLRESFTLHYIDMEDDEVSISSDEELLTALMYSKRKEDEPFRLFIQLIKSVGPNKSYEGSTHFGITCDGCAEPVAGFRYKCLQCEDYDLCGKCESNGAHPQHTFIRVTRELPACWTNMKQLLEGGKIPHHHRRHSFRGMMHRAGVKNRGSCSFAYPNGIRVEVDPEFCQEPPKKEGNTCPFAGPGYTGFQNPAYLHHFENAAQMFQNIASNENLQNIGRTISTILEQFGVPAQQPEPNCPTGCFKPEEGGEAKTGNADKEEAVKEAAATPDSETIPATNPYAPLAQAAAAVNTAVAATSPADSTGSIEKPTIPVSAQDSDDWTMIERAKKESRASSPTELGARPKTPLNQRKETRKEEARSDASDPLIDGALETMLGMGFTNEGGWLAQLLRVKNGDIGKVLDVLNAQIQRQ